MVELTVYIDFWQPACIARLSLNCYREVHCLMAERDVKSRVVAIAVRRIQLDGKESVMNELIT